MKFNFPPQTFEGIDGMIEDERDSSRQKMLAYLSDLMTGTAAGERLILMLRSVPDWRFDVIVERAHVAGLRVTDPAGHTILFSRESLFGKVTGLFAQLGWQPSRHGLIAPAVVVPTKYPAGLAILIRPQPRWDPRASPPQRGDGSFHL